MKLNQSIMIILATVLLISCLGTPVYANCVYRDNPSDVVPHIQNNLVVIGSLDDYPIMYANLEGEASGLAVDLLNAFGDTYGYRMRYELYPTAKVDAIFKDHGDIRYISAPLDSTDGISKQLTFYYKDYSLFTRNQILGLNTSFERIAHQLQSQRNDDALIGYKGQDSHKTFLQEKLDILPYKNYDTYASLLKDLNDEKIAYALIPDDLGLKLLKEFNYRQIQCLHTTIFTESSSFVLSNKSNYLYYDLNQFLSGLKENGQRSQMISKWFDDQSESKQMSRLIIGFNILAVLLIISILLMAYRNFVMQKIIDGKTAEIIEQTHVNEQLYSKLLKREQYKNSYFLNLSHELRTPISVILNAAQMISNNSYFNKDSDASESSDCTKAQKYNGIIKNNCYRLLRVITNLIDVNRLDTSDFSLRQQPLDLVDLLHKLRQQLMDQEYIPAECLTIESNEEPVIVMADAYELSRVFLNLISNSLKFCDREPEIVIHIQKEQESVAISYRDNSTGITEEMLPELFTRFYFESSVLIKKHEGSGLGLYLVRELLAMHKGKIEVITKPHHFSYKITLPLSPTKLSAPLDLEFKLGDFNQLMRMEFASIGKRKS